ncbi:MAG: hypothetical protein SFT81_06270 [Candidatus Caenarcaniphilales bacterium]|nr:hypothetical protein [Candidatus Caenarcaniphilales bacterium]
MSKKSVALAMMVASMLFVSVSTPKAQAADTLGIIGTSLGGAALGLSAINSIALLRGARGGGGFGGGNRFFYDNYYAAPGPSFYPIAPGYSNVGIHTYNPCCMVPYGGYGYTAPGYAHSYGYGYARYGYY